MRVSPLRKTKLIVAALHVRRYTHRDIGDCFGLHYALVSKLPALATLAPNGQKRRADPR
jgi:hypothetical protein